MSLLDEWAKGKPILLWNGELFWDTYSADVDVDGADFLLCIDFNDFVKSSEDWKRKPIECMESFERFCEARLKKKEQETAKEILAWLMKEQYSDEREFRKRFLEKELRKE